VFPVPAQAGRVGVETSGRYDLLAMPRSNLFGDRTVGQAAQALADTQRKVIFDGDKPAIEQAVECSREANAVGRVCAATFIHAPRNDVPGDEALNNRQAGDTATTVVAAQNRVAKE
jgi:hypothetical protein